MTSLGKRVLADVINYIKMRSYWNTVGSKSMTGFLRRKDDTGRWPCDDKRRKDNTAVRWIETQGETAR